MNQTRKAVGQTKFEGDGVGLPKKLPPLNIQDSRKQTDKAARRQQSKTEEISGETSKTQDIAGAKSSEKGMGNRKQSVKDPSSPKKVKPTKPPKPDGLAQRARGDLSLSATHYSLERKKTFVTNTQKQREIDKLTNSQENAHKNAQKSTDGTTPSGESKLPGVDQLETDSEAPSSTKPGSVTINLFVGGELLTKAASATDVDPKSLSGSGRQLSLQLPLDQLDLLQSLPNIHKTASKPLAQVSERERESLDSSQTYPSPSVNSNSQGAKYEAQIPSEQVGLENKNKDSHLHADADEAGSKQAVQPQYGHRGPVWLMGGPPQTPGRPELPPIRTDSRMYVPPSSTEKFSQRGDENQEEALHDTYETKAKKFNRKRRRKHRRQFGQQSHHQLQDQEPHQENGGPVQQPGDEKVMMWLDEHEFEVTPSEMDQYAQDRFSVSSSFDRLPSAAQVHGSYEDERVFKMQQMVALRQMQSQMTGANRQVRTPLAWSQDGDDFTENHDHNKAHRGDRYGPESFMGTKRSSHPRTDHYHRGQRPTETTAENFQSMQEKPIADSLHKNDMGTQADDPATELANQRMQCSNQDTQKIVTSVHNDSVHDESGYSTWNSTTRSDQRAFSRSQVSGTSSHDRPTAPESRSKNVPTLKVLREDEELGHSNSATYRTAHYRSNFDDQRQTASKKGNKSDMPQVSNELDMLLGDEESYVLLLKTQDGAVLGPFQLDIDNVEIGFPTFADVLDENIQG